MHQMAYPVMSAGKRHHPVQKSSLEDADLQVVADLICDGLREGLYVEILPGKKRSEVVRFLRRLVTKCEIRHFDPIKKSFRKRAAALFVYTVKGDVVGFGVLGQVFSKSITSGFYFKDDTDYGTGTDADHRPMIPGGLIPSDLNRHAIFRLHNPASREEDKAWIKNGVELLMFGVAPLQRGYGYGASILDSLIKRISHKYFNFIVRCPSENQLLFAMLVTRGFLAVSRDGRGRVLHLRPPPRDSSAWSGSNLSRYSG